MNLLSKFCNPHSCWKKNVKIPLTLPPFLPIFLPLTPIDFNNYAAVLPRSMSHPNMFRQNQASKLHITRDEEKT